jgi:signal transduction histidine kinase
MIGRLDDALMNSKRFVADASHDLRTPLTILQGELESLAEDTGLTAEVRDRAGSMLEEVVHLGKIVEQLFTLSRLDAGEGQSGWTCFDLGELAKTTAEQMSLLAEDKGISIACDIGQKAPVKANQVRFKQVVVNLLDNAIKYTPAQGAIQLRVATVNGHATLEVQDNGIGIAPENLPHIFERFYRVDATRSANADSAGLGLAIVKSICAAHGGQVLVESTENQGSKFEVELPLAGGGTPG